MRRINHDKNKSVEKTMIHTLFLKKTIRKIHRGKGQVVKIKEY